jgi:hypothetical protein
MYDQELQIRPCSELAEGATVFKQIGDKIMQVAHATT